MSEFDDGGGTPPQRTQPQGKFYAHTTTNKDLVVCDVPRRIDGDGGAASATGPAPVAREGGGASEDSALAASVRARGSNSYYFAHGEDRSAPASAKVENDRGHPAPCSPRWRTTADTPPLARLGGVVRTRFLCGASSREQPFSTLFSSGDLRPWHHDRRRAAAARDRRRFRRQRPQRRGRPRRRRRRRRRR